MFDAIPMERRYPTHQRFPNSRPLVAPGHIPDQLPTRRSMKMQNASYIITFRHRSTKYAPWFTLEGHICAVYVSAKPSLSLYLCNAIINRTTRVCSIMSFCPDLHYTHNIHLIARHLGWAMRYLQQVLSSLYSTAFQMKLSKECDTVYTVFWHNYQWCSSIRVL